jgi:scyllo-inositol 2-dehydrogenase (NADP+)
MQSIQTALLSFGMSGQVFHAPFLHLHPGFNFYAVWERTKNIAAEKYPAVKTYRTFEEILSDDEIELLVVNTPNYTHYDYVKRALSAGKHVVVEKPFVATVQEGEELIALSKKQNKVLSVFQNRRWDSDFQTVKKVLENKWLGELVEAEFHFDRYKEELSPKAHKEVPGPGTGSLYDLGSHIIDQALHLFGMPQLVFGDIRIVRPISQVDDYFELLLYYPGLRVRLHSSYLVREPQAGYILNGSKGSFIKSRADVQELQLQSGFFPDQEGYGVEPESESGLIHTEWEGKVKRETLPTENGNYLAYYEGIYQAIRENKQPPVTATDGLNVIRIINAAIESSEQKCLIRV